MKKHILCILGLSFFFFYSIGCKQKLSNEALYKSGLEKNIEICVGVLVEAGYDTISAGAICSCALEKAYIADSNFVKMKQEEFAKFMKDERIYEICDSIFKRAH